MNTSLIRGEEPPERRSLGPASYDPRRAHDYIKPTTRCGGDIGKFDKDYYSMTLLRDGTYLHRGINQASATASAAVSRDRSREVSPMRSARAH